jgi:hypothetical protein
MIRLQLRSLFHRAARTSMRRTLRRRPPVALERLEARLTPAATLLDIAANRPAVEPGFPAYPQLPIPAGATLVDTSDSGLQVLFSSTDPNVVAGQETVPFPDIANLFWMDLSAGLDNPTIRLVTHFAGSTSASTGYTGIGTGLVMPFVPGTADLSGDGQTVVFDSWINAHDYDASVPAANDQPSNAYLAFAIPLGGGSLQLINVEGHGTADVFAWHAQSPDPANNIVAVSLLNAAGKAAAVNQAAVYPAGFPVPDPTKPMVTGVFPVEPPLGFSPVWQAFEPTEADTTNHGVSDDGKRVLYATNVPAQWIDSADATVAPGWTLDGFLVDRVDLPSAAALEASGSTQTVTKYVDGATVRALGSYQSNLPWGTGVIPADVFVAQFLQMSADGNRVVYSSRVPSNVLVSGTTDTNFSLDVFAYDVKDDKNIVVSTRAGQPTVAAGAGQADYPTTAPPTVFSLDLYSSQNHAVSRDGTTIAITSTAANLVSRFVDNNVTFRPNGFVVGPPPSGGAWLQFKQHAPWDIYAVRPDARTAFLVNTPDGTANTNLNATFGGMSADGTTLLFGTAANNFYTPAFGKPPYLPFATGPVPKNFLLGGFSNLWARKVDAGTTILVTSSWRNNSSGNQATLASAVLPGARDLLPNVSETGRFVMFQSSSNNLAAGINDRTFKGGVFLRDMTAGVTTLVSTTATGNVPSAGRFLEYALSTPDAAGTTRTFLGGTGGGDMQGRFRTEEVAPLTAHVYAADYPLAVPASAATNRDLFSVSAAGSQARTVVEYRGTEPTVKASPGAVLPGSSGPWRTATGDVNGDGVADYVYGAGLGGRNTVVVIDGRTNAEIFRVNAFAGGTLLGVFVATGDVNRDGYADVIVGTGGGRPARVAVYDGKRGNVLAQFAALGGRAVAVRVAGGDVDGDGYADIVAANGAGMRSTVEVYGGKRLVDGATAAQARLAAFAVSATPGRPAGTQSVYVAAADMTGDGKAEIVATFDGAATATILDGLSGRVISSTNLGPSFAKGATVAARAGRIMVGSVAGAAPAVRVLGYANLVWTIGVVQSPKLPGIAATNKFGIFVG